MENLWRILADSLVFQHRRRKDAEKNNTLKSPPLFPLLCDSAPLRETTATPSENSHLLLSPLISMRPSSTPRNTDLLDNILHMLWWGRSKHGYHITNSYVDDHS